MLANVTPQAADLVAAPLEDLLADARRLRRNSVVTYSPKVFIPLTTLCRDVCGYCTFARPPRRGERAFMTEEQVLEIARAGAAAGCREALFTLGDKPELRYRVARDELRGLGCETTLEYLARCARLVLEETGLVPHLNPGVMSRAELEALRAVSASMGIMLETTAERLAAKGGPHWASPDKVPARRLETIRLAGELAIPFTSGILIGIGETREERIVDDGGFEPGRARCGKCLLHGDPERGEKAVGGTQRERVHSAVAGGGEGEWGGGLGEGIERLRADERAVGHHDEGSFPGTLVPKRQGDGVRVPRACIAQDLDFPGREAGIGCHE
jgi:hypothetical protein